MRPKVAGAERSQDRIGYRMRERISIGMAVRAQSLTFLPGPIPGTGAVDICLVPAENAEPFQLRAEA